MQEAEFDCLVRQRIAAVDERIAAACGRAGRARSEVTVVAVTKTISAELARRVPGLGLSDLGENRPQELVRKAALLTDIPVIWHMIGHLQRNKIDLVLPIATRIHAVDSLRLLDALEAAAAKSGVSVSVLLEVNASGEATKHGFAPAEVPALDMAIAALRHVRVDGLMTMAAPADDPEACRPTFRTLRKLRDRLGLRELSMGMTNDFEIAIEEGTTMVRLGSVYFEGCS
ncbi:MAG TPA: YggS family pyridoxal phosphate-dependent enzyme [Gemmataceae bacterium]|nr:YggS family pyridoxal phosphate-dependent enzyme [Gemmataceae bacterium]